jgi:hypothetical protein
VPRDLQSHFHFCSSSSFPTLLPSRQTTKRTYLSLQIGPRLELQLFKVQEDLAKGRVLHHQFEERAPEDAAAQEVAVAEAARLKAERRRQQEENVRKKAHEAARTHAAQQARSLHNCLCFCAISTRMLCGHRLLSSQATVRSGCCRSGMNVWGVTRVRMMQAEQEKKEAKRKREGPAAGGGKLPKRQKGAERQWWEDGGDDDGGGAAAEADDDVDYYTQEVRVYKCNACMVLCLLDSWHSCCRPRLRVGAACIERIAWATGA